MEPHFHVPINKANNGPTARRNGNSRGRNGNGHAFSGRILVLLVVVTALVVGGFVAVTSRSHVAEFLQGPVQDSPEVLGKDVIVSYDPEAQWFPEEVLGTAEGLVAGTAMEPPEVPSKSALLVELGSGKVLFEKNSKEVLPIASLTKIMTAVVSLERTPLDTVFTVSEAAEEVGENSMGVTAGEKYTFDELLCGLILHSGNDAAYVIAEGVSGDEARFVDLMNQKAKELGLKNTYFADSSGLEDGTHSTTVDLVKLTKYAMKFPYFREVVKTVEIELPGVMADTPNGPNGSEPTHKFLYLYNQTNLLSTYPGVEGVKTGYTEEAGLCLVTYARHEDLELVGVVLNSPNRKGDMILMLDHGFGGLGIEVEHNLLDY